LCLKEIWNDAPKNAPFVDNEGDLAWGPVVLCDNMACEYEGEALDI